MVNTAAVWKYFCGEVQAGKTISSITCSGQEWCTISWRFLEKCIHG